MRAADRALYLAKARGRNRVEITDLASKDTRTALRG
jgi:two-component system cell cycle response regulator